MNLFQFPVISLGGQIGSGKNSVSDLIDSQLFPGLKKIAFADEVKNVICKLMKVDRDFIEYWKRKEEIPPGFAITMRETMILVGDVFRQISPTIWIDHVLPPISPLLITDARYDNETQIVADGGGFTVLIFRPDFVNSIKNKSEQESIQHALRFYDLGYRGLLPKEEKLFRYFLVNDGNESDLLKQVNEDLIPNILRHFNVK